MGKFVDRTGQRYGHLTALARVPGRSGKYLMWKCQCACGKLTVVPSESLRTGNTRSCGCRERWPYEPRPSTPLPTMHPTTADLYWAAGFLDGEGCFHQGPRTLCAVTATQNDPELLHRLAAMFGGRVWWDKSHTRPIGVWGVYGQIARGVMMTLYKLLSKKRQGEIRSVLARVRAA